jgi:mono/diheme cytochrome c family protein
MRTQVKAGLITGCLLLAACMLACFQYMRMHSFSARETPNPVEALLARKLRSLAVAPGVKELKNPIKPTPFVLAAGRDHFADHCAICHGNRGDGKTPIGEGLYPPPPDMRLADTQNLSDGEIMFIIKNGIRFTGMPGWGGKDEENWRLVWFIRHLPKLSDKEVKLMNEINHAEDGK